MITSLELYLLTRLDHLNALCTGLIMVCVVLFAISLFAYLNFKFTLREYQNDTKEHDRLTWYCGRSSVVLFICVTMLGVVRTFLPTTKEMATIIVLPKLINTITANEQLKQVPDNLMRLVNEWIIELKPKKEENK